MLSGLDFLILVACLQWNSLLKSEVQCTDPGRFTIPFYSIPKHGVREVWGALCVFHRVQGCAVVLLQISVCKQSAQTIL